MHEKATKPDVIVQEAYQVFCKSGFQSTCVDEVLKKSGISKRTLYKYFRSKEELIAATVTYYQDKMLSDIKAEVERRYSDPKNQILAIFDLKKEAFESGNFSGCFALSAKLEYDGKDPNIEKACQGFVEKLKDYIAILCKKAGFKKAAQLATEIMIVLEGTIIYSQTQKDPMIAVLARKMAAQLLKNNS